MPTSASGRAARSACTARPWPSIRWCAARTAPLPSVPAGRVHARAVAEERRAPRLVQRGPVAAPGRRARRATSVGVVGEPGGGVPGRPAAGVLERLRQVPVVERQPRLDAVGQQLVDQPAVEVEPGRVGRPGAAGLHPGPGDREPVRLQAQLGHQRDVVAVAVVVVARHVAGVPADDPARGVAEGVPDRRGAAVLGRRALDLVRGGRRAPEEAGREGQPGRARRGRRRRVGWRGCSRLDRTFHDAADDLAAEHDEHDHQGQGRRPPWRRTPASSRCSRRTRGRRARPAAVGLSGVRMAYGQRNCSSLHEGQQAEHAGGRAQRGQHDAPVDPERASSRRPGPASISSSEIAWLAYCRIMNTPKRADQERHGRPRSRVSYQPRSCIMPQSGMRPSWVGTIMVTMIASSSALLPRNLSLAKAKPASEPSEHDARR